MLTELRVSWGFVAADARSGRGERPRFVADAELVRDDAAALLAFGRELWPSDRRDIDHATDRAMRWLFDPEVDAELLDPRGLCQGLGDDIERRWGAVVRTLLLGAAGEDVLDQLRNAVDAGEPVRISIHARDGRAARIPVETFRWRPEDRDPAVPGLSIVRVAPRLRSSPSGEPPEPLRTFGAKSRNKYRPLVVRTDGAPETERSQASVAHGPAGALPRVDPPAVVVGLGELSRGGVERARLQEADLLVVTGHGRPGATYVTGGNRAETLAARPLANTLLATLGEQQRPSCVVIASCGSAEWPAESDGDAVAAAFAGAGAALTIGFQGEEIKEADALTFVGRLSEHWRTTIAALPPGQSPTLTDWEAAIAVARAMIHPSAAVVHVHPALLAGRTPHQQSASRRKPGGPRDVVVAPLFAVAQVAWVTDPSTRRALRLPLPVDLGCRLRVTVGDAAASPPSAEAALVCSVWPELRGRLTVEELRPLSPELRQRLAPSHLRAAVERAARVAAVVRALRAPGGPVPEDVERLVTRLVKAGLATPDGSVSLIAVGTGETVDVLFDRWPPIAVRLLGKPSLERTPSEHDDEARLGLAEVREAVGAGDIAGLLARQRERFFEHSLLTPRWRHDPVGAVAFAPGTVEVVDVADDAALTPHVAELPSDLPTVDVPPFVAG